MSTTGGSGTGWEDALDALEAQLAAQAVALDAAGAHPPDDLPFVPPAVDGPVPPVLLPRLEALLRRGDELIDRTVTLQAQLRAELAKPASPTAPRRVEPSMLDSRV
jgi:hypothetical protein